MGKQRFVLQKLCNEYCILDYKPDDLDYYLKTECGKIVVFPKIIESMPARNYGNLKKMKQRLKKIRKENR